MLPAMLSVTLALAQIAASRTALVTVADLRGRTIVDIEEDALRLAGPGGTETIVLNLADVSGVRAYDEEPS